MATLPLYLNQDGIYAAEDLALPWRELREGVITTPPLPTGVTDPLKVGPIAPASMGVQVAPGACNVRNLGANDSEAYYRGGMWRVAFTSAQQVALDASHATLGRYDLIVVEVLDTQFGGASNVGRLRVVKGTPAASPAIPAAPRSTYALAWVAIAPAATTITAANIGDLRAVAAGPLGPAARVTNVAPQTIPNNTETVLGFDTEQVDLGIVHDPGFPGRLYSRLAGLYLITGTVLWSPNAAGYRELHIKVTSAAVAGSSQQPRTGDAWCYQTVSMLAPMSATDYAELIASQTCGAALNVQNQRFGIARVAPLT